MITVVGLGCKAEDLPEGGKAAILSGAKVLLRTGETDCAAAVKALGVPYETLDSVYPTCRNFDTLNKKLAAAVLEAGRSGDVVYCVDGGVSDDISAQILLRKDKTARVICGVGKADSAFSACRIFSPCRSGVSAYALPAERPNLPLAVYDLDCDLIASDVKLTLTSFYGDEAPAFFVRGGRAKKMRLYELDREKKYDANCCVVIGEIPLLKRTRFDFSDLLAVLRLLRAPNGCPWDRVQTHESICKNMIEEAYELVDAVHSGDDDKILEETGDVLMQGAFHSLLAEERGVFDSYDVFSGVCEKLIFRHSHIFGKDEAKTEDGALSVWEKNKAEEKGQKTAADTVRDVPKVFPAVMRAQKVGKRAAKFGYDFESAAQAGEKVKEELCELLEALGGGDAARISEETGDLLFSAVNVGRLAGADCEESLQASTEKFVQRFCRTEELILQDGKRMQDLPSAELWEYYERAKRNG